MVKETKVTLSLSKGMKQTEIGLIPEDWEVKKLGSFCYITKLAGFEYSKYFNSYKDGGNIIVVRGTNITNNQLDLRDVKYIPEHISKFLIRSKLFINDLVFAYVGTIGPIYLIEESNRFHLGPNTAKIRIDDSSIDSNFIHNYFLSELIKKEIDDRISIGAQPSLSMSKIRDFSIICPPLAEQEAIAKALSDCDSWIDSIEEVLAKKRLIKQGAMQELLTPKEDWEVKKLGEVGEIITGGTPSTLVGKYWGAEIPWITPTDINVSKNIYSGERSLSLEGIKQIRSLKPNSLLITCIASIGKNAILRSFGGCNQQINAITPNEYFNVDYLYYLFEINKSVLIGKAGITATLMVSKAVFSTIEFNFPSLSEQTRIATILSDMDLEIEALEEKLGKARQIKQGMMQELLTGRVRLV